MNKLEECLECLGTGETIYKGKFNKPCKTCDGKGMTTKLRNYEYTQNLDVNGTNL